MFMMSNKINSLPFTHENVNYFASWAINIHKLRPVTVKSYLQTLALMHRLNNLSDECCKQNGIVDLIIKGAENLSIYKMFGPAKLNKVTS